MFLAFIYVAHAHVDGRLYLLMCELVLILALLARAQTEPKRVTEFAATKYGPIQTKERRVWQRRL